MIHNHHTERAQVQRAVSSLALRAAILERALLDLAVGNASVRDDASAYVFSDDDTHPFTFVSICDVLDLDAAKIRATIGKPRRCGHCDELFERAGSRFCSARCQIKAGDRQRHRAQGWTEEYV